MVQVTDYLRTLFLHPPSFEGFDGGAGSRYQARREVRSFWYPTWLAQPAALVPGSRLVDAPPAGLTTADVLPLANSYDLAVLHTSAPSFASDVKVAEAMKGENPRLRIGFVGAHVAVQREAALTVSPVIDFVAGNEFDFTIQEIAQGRALASVAGISYRNGDGGTYRTPERAILEDMDSLPFVTDVYKRDLVVEQYFIGRARPQALAEGPESVQLKEHEGQRLAIPLAELHRALQLGHERRVVQQTGQTVAMHQLADAPAPGSAGDDGLHQQRCVRRNWQEVIRSSPERGDPIGQVVLSEENHRKQLVAGVLPNHPYQRERIGIHRP